MIRLKDVFKLAGVSIVSFCAVFICTLFLNYNRDLGRIKGQIPEGMVKILYDAMVMTGKVISAVSGGCLLFTSIIILCFYIRHYIDAHKKELGILKALGYSNLKIAGKFWIFGLSVFFGCSLGFGFAFAFLPFFYKVQNEEGILPEVPVHFNPELFVFLVIVPAVFFALLAVGYSYLKIKCPVLTLLKEKESPVIKSIRKERKGGGEYPFLQEMKKSIVKSRKTLVFFIWFASFCYSSMMQMAAGMDELASELFSVMILLIGLVLAFVTLLLAVTTVVNANTKIIAIMHVFGYSFKECAGALLGGYRPVAYAGFAVGAVYQYALLKIMVSVVFKNWEGVPEYDFNWKVFWTVLASFALIYELIMYAYALRIKKVSLKEIILE